MKNPSKPAFWVVLSALLLTPQYLRAESTETVKAPAQETSPEPGTVGMDLVKPLLPPSGLYKPEEGPFTTKGLFSFFDRFDVGGDLEKEYEKEKQQRADKGKPDTPDLITGFDIGFINSKSEQIDSAIADIEKKTPGAEGQTAADEARIYAANLHIKTGSDKNPRGYENALKTLGPAYGRRGDDPAVLNIHAQANLGLGNYEATVDDTTRAVENNKEDERAYMLRSLAYYQMKNYTQAMEDAKRTLALNPNNETAYRIAKLSAGRVTKAKDLGLNAMQQAAAKQIDREFESMSQQRNQLEAQTQTVSLKTMTAQGPKPGGGRVADAISMIRMNDPQGAIQVTSKVLQQSPENIEAWYARAAAENLLGQHENAVEDATYVLDHDPNNFKALDTRAQALISLKRFQEAKADADASIAINPDSPYGIKNRALANEGLGNIAEMISDFRAAARLGPEFETELQAIAQKYQIPLEPVTLRPLEPPGALTKMSADKQSRRRFLVVMASSITGGLLIAFGLVHIVMGGGRKAGRVVLPGGGGATAQALGSPGLAAGYDILKEVGHGGMGVVYEAMDKALNRKVAIKKMRDEIHDDVRERQRFLEEARIVAALHHTNIVDIHNILEDEGDLYMIFEYVEGSTIDQILAKKRRLSVSEARFIVHGVTAALTYAHAKGVIHRDLKPSNIMITKDGIVKVMDFGIARQAQDAIAASTKTNTVAGTPHYMAPEQERGIVRKESDIFALGACLYEMLTGERPYASPATTDSKINKRYQKASRVASNLPPQLDALIDSALEPDPDKRIHTASDFRSRLDAIRSTDEPLS